jgi:dUTP pyrophosphatase
MSRRTETLKFKRMHPDARIDFPVHEGDVGYDIYAVEEVSILPGENAIVPVGLAFEIPEGYYLTVETRSGHGCKKGLRVHRGIVDQGYRGVLDVSVYNHNKPLAGWDTPYVVKKGEKIAQLVLHTIEVFPLQAVLEVKESARGEGKCGSTDKK